MGGVDDWKEEGAVEKEMKAKYGRVCEITDESIDKATSDPDVRAEVKAAMVEVGKETDDVKKAKRFAELVGKATSAGKAAMELVAKGLGAVVLVLVLAGPAMALPEDWVGNMWQDLKDNSHVNLAQNIAVGAQYGFVLHNRYIGVKHSIWNYRRLHLEYGALLPYRHEPEPILEGKVTHSLGVSLYLRPFLEWARLPEKFVLLRDLYVGPTGGYDFHRWDILLQVHLPFGGNKPGGK